MWGRGNQDTFILQKNWLGKDGGKGDPTANCSKSGKIKFKSSIIKIFKKYIYSKVLINALASVRVCLAFSWCRFDVLIVKLKLKF